MLSGCSKNFNKTEKEHNYDVIEVLNNHAVREKMIFYSFPVPPPNLSLYNDSIFKGNLNKDTIQSFQKLIKKNGKLIVAIDTVLEPSFVSHIKNNYLNNCLDKGFKKLYTSFKNLKDTLNIDVLKIYPNAYSYIIPNRIHYREMPRGGFEKFNILLKFSRIAFNKKYNKAIVMMAVKFGKLNGFSTIYFLEKKEEMWSITCSKNLTIS